MIIWKNVNTYPISLSPGSGCSLKIPAARPARWANTAAVWCEGEGAMVGTQAEDGEGARDVRRQGWSCVRARARERVPHTPVRSYARTHAHTHALCVCLYVYMFASAYVCTSANGQADQNAMERLRTDAAPETVYCILSTQISACLVGLLRIRLIRRQFVNLRIHLTAVGWDRICSKSKPKVMEKFFVSTFWMLQVLDGTIHLDRNVWRRQWRCFDWVCIEEHRDELTKLFIEREMWFHFDKNVRYVTLNQFEGLDMISGAVFAMKTKEYWTENEIS